MTCLQEKPDDSELLNLLNHAFNGWGTKEYFEWKYNSFPHYKPEKHNFLVFEETGDLVGAKRIFKKYLCLPYGEKVPVHVHGGSVVHEDYRGRGHYSSMLSKSMDYSSEKVDHNFTFNREGKITTKHHKKEGWKWVTLPIYVKIISPSNVLANYLLEDNYTKGIANYLSKVDRQLTKSKIASKMFANGAELFYGDSKKEKNEKSFVRNENNYELEAIDGDKVSKELVIEVAEYINERVVANYHFERNEKIIEHCLAYPNGKLFLARDEDDQEIVDVVVAGLLEKQGLRECRILEQTWSEPEATKLLLSKVENYIRKLKGDVMAICTDRRPGSDWIKMDTEYMMWPGSNNKDGLPNEISEWRITTYDVV